jgi:iron complex outermembrane receptor protein
VNYVGQSLLPSRIEQNVLDGEVVYKTKIAVNEMVSDDLRIGFEYRYKNVEWSYLDHDRFEHHYGLFLHDELNLGKRFAVIADYRIDWVPYLESFQQSPRGAVLFHPTKTSTIRGSFGLAYRKPTFLESYLRLPVQLPVAGTASNIDGVRRDDPSFIVQPERILSAELGYLNQDSEYFTAEAAAYFNRVSSLIQLSSNRPITVADFPVAGVQDQATGFYPAGFGGWENQCQAYNVFGGELGMHTFPVEGLDVYGNYTLNVTGQDNSNCTAEQLSRIVPDQRTSQHKVNGGVQLRTKPGFDASIDLHVVTLQSWAEQVTNFLRQQIEQERFRVSAYTLLNTRLGYRFLDNQADVGIMAFNLLGIQHREHPFGQLLDRRVMLQLGYRF